MTPVVGLAVNGTNALPCGIQSAWEAQPSKNDCSPLDPGLWYDRVFDLTAAWLL